MILFALMALIGVIVISYSSARAERTHEFGMVDKTQIMVRSPGFEPGSSARGADVLARLDYDRITGVVENTLWLT